MELCGNIFSFSTHFLNVNQKDPIIKRILLPNWIHGSCNRYIMQELN